MNKPIFFYFHSLRPVTYFLTRLLITKLKKHLKCYEWSNLLLPKYNSFKQAEGRMLITYSVSILMKINSFLPVVRNLPISKKAKRWKTIAHNILHGNEKQKKQTNKK